MLQIRCNMDTSVHFAHTYIHVLLYERYIHALHVYSCSMLQVHCSAINNFLNAGTPAKHMRTLDEAACNTLLDHRQIWCHSSCDPLRTAIELNNKGIVDDDLYHLCGRDDLHDSTKRNMIMGSIISTGGPGAFQSFVAILESNPVNTGIVKSLKGMILKHILLVWYIHSHYCDGKFYFIGFSLLRCI